MTENTRRIAIAAAVLLAANLACISPGGTPPPIATVTEAPATAVPLAEPTESPTAVPTEPSTAVPTEPPAVSSPTVTSVEKSESGAVSLEITNETDMDIWYVYVSPAKSDEWGEDWLEDTIILAGETHVIEGIPEGIYDMRAEDQDAQAIEVAWDVRVEGKTFWTLSGQASLEVFNASDEVIAYLYISPVDSDSWGGDWLGEAVIDVGSGFTADGIPPGVYDIQAANMDDESIEMAFSVELSTSRSWQVTGRADLPSGAVLRFEDDFSDNRNNWASDPGDENVRFMKPSGGEYCMQVENSDWTAWEWYEPFRPDEFVAEVSCVLEDVSDASCGLGFGPDGDNLYWFEVSPYDQTFALFLLEDDVWQDALIGWTEAKAIDPAGANFLSMERVGGVLSLYVNGVFLTELDGSRFPTGRIGIGGSTYADAPVTVCLDDLRVWRIE